MTTSCSSPPSREEFLAMPEEEVACLVRQAGPQVCVFPINGTRRWAWLEHVQEIIAADDAFSAYMDIAEQAYVRLFSMLFKHGIDTILSPLFGNELLQRGEQYVQSALSGVRRFATSPTFTDFYDSLGVRVRFYGDFRRKLAPTPHTYLLDLIQALTQRTASNAPYRLFLGLFADDPLGQIAEITIEHYRQYGQTPDRNALVRAYYGEELPPATLFLGFDRPAVYDYPLLASGQEDLYFTVAPSPYLNVTTLRRVLYDHLYTRRVSEPAWEKLSDQAAEALRTYYRKKANQVQGIGQLKHGVWLPEETW